MSTVPSPESWRRSSRCDSSTCVEVARVDGAVLLRDSERPEAFLTFTPASWVVFLAAARAGEFDLG